MKLIIFILSVMSVVSCRSIPYKEDMTLLSSGEAKSPQALITIQGDPCSSMGKIGLCYLEQNRGEDLLIFLEPQPYDYKFKLICSSWLNFQTERLIPEYSERLIKIPHDKFDRMVNKEGKEVYVFECEGSIRKANNPDFSFKSFLMRVKIIHKESERRMEIEKIKYKKRYYLVFGQYAKYGMVEINGKRKYFKKKPFYKLSRKAKNIRAWSCSSKERCNYFGY